MGPVPGLERLKDDILTDLDVEESRLDRIIRPRTEDTRARRASASRSARRASEGWDDAVEARTKPSSSIRRACKDVVGLRRSLGFRFRGSIRTRCRPAYWLRSSSESMISAKN